MWDSYRPIALLNGEAKILAKIIFNRLAPFVHDFIKETQAGFVAKRSIQDNLGKAYAVVYDHYAHASGEALVKLHREKVFDCLE